MTPEQQRRALAQALVRWRWAEMDACVQIRLLTRLQTQPWWWFFLNPMALVHASIGTLHAVLTLGRSVEEVASIVVFGWNKEDGSGGGPTST